MIDPVHSIAPLVHTLTVTLTYATCVCTCTLGLALHRSVIQEEEALVGAYHHRIAAKYLQAASCALQAQPIQASAGRDFTQRTEETMRRNPHVAYSEYERETLQHFKDVLQM